MNYKFKNKIFLFSSLFILLFSGCSSSKTEENVSKYGDLLLLDQNVALMIRDEALANRGTFSSMEVKSDSVSTPSILFGTNVYFIKDQKDIVSSLNCSTSIGSNDVINTKKVESETITDSKGKYSSTKTINDEIWIDDIVNSFYSNKYEFNYITTVNNGIKSIIKTTTQLENNNVSGYLKEKIETSIFPNIGYQIKALQWYSNADLSLVYGLSSSISNGTYVNPYDGTTIISSTEDSFAIMINKNSANKWIISSIEKSIITRILYSPEGELLSTPLVVSSNISTTNFYYEEKQELSHTNWNGTDASDIDIPVINFFDIESKDLLPNSTISFVNRTSEYSFLNPDFNGSYFELRNILLTTSFCFAFSTNTEMAFTKGDFSLWGYKSIDINKSTTKISPLDNSDFIKVEENGTYTIIIKESSSLKKPSIIITKDSESGL